MSLPERAARSARDVPHRRQYIAQPLWEQADRPCSLRLHGIEKVEVSKKFYNGADESYAELADKAGKLGADAVVQAHQWRAPSGFAWAAPHAGGLAVKWTPEGRQFAEGLDGLCSGARK
jgi:hypothetical protein